MEGRKQASMKGKQGKEGREEGRKEGSFCTVAKLKALKKQRIAYLQTCTQSKNRLSEREMERRERDRERERERKALYHTRLP